MSAATNQLAAGLFITEELGAHALKGVARPMEIYRLLRRAECEAGARRRPYMGLRLLSDASKNGTCSGHTGNGPRRAPDGPS